MSKLVGQYVPDEQIVQWAQRFVRYPSPQTVRFEAEPEFRNTVLLLVPGLHRGTMPAVKYARSIGGDVRGVYVEIEPEKTGEVLQRWSRWVPDIPLIVLPSPYRSLTQPVLDYIDAVQAERDDDMVSVIIPEFDPPSFWSKLLHNQSGLRLKWALLNKPGVVVTNVRYHLARQPDCHVPAHLFQEAVPGSPEATVE